MAPPKQINHAAPPFPVVPLSHGNEMVTVQVGTHPRDHTFTIHKRLLSQASSYFDRALNGHFKEPSTNTLHLEHHCMIAFEALYHWLYTEEIFSPKDLRHVKNIGANYEIDSWEQVFWLRLFKLADETMVTALKRTAYSALTQDYFCRTIPRMPDIIFLKELFGAKNRQEILEAYVVEYASYCILNYVVTKSLVWQVTFDNVPQYGTRVFHRLVHFSEYSSATDVKVQHPANQLSYSTDTVCPAERLSLISEPEC